MVGNTARSTAWDGTGTHLGGQRGTAWKRFRFARGETERNHNLPARQSGRRCLYCGGQQSGALSLQDSRKQIQRVLENLEPRELIGAEHGTSLLEEIAALACNFAAD